MYVLPETLTLAQASAAVKAIEAALGEGRVERDPLVIDATGLRSFDTAAIAVLLEARRLRPPGETSSCAARRRRWSSCPGCTASMRCSDSRPPLPCLIRSARSAWRAGCA